MFIHRTSHLTTQGVPYTTSQPSSQLFVSLHAKVLRNCPASIATTPYRGRRRQEGGETVLTNAASCFSYWYDIDTDNRQGSFTVLLHVTTSRPPVWRTSNWRRKFFGRWCWRGRDVWAGTSAVPGGRAGGHRYISSNINCSQVNIPDTLQVF